MKTYSRARPKESAADVTQPSTSDLASTPVVNSTVSGALLSPVVLDVNYYSLEDEANHIALRRARIREAERNTVIGIQAFNCLATAAGAGASAYATPGEGGYTGNYVPPGQAAMASSMEQQMLLLPGPVQPPLLAAPKQPDLLPAPPGIPLLPTREPVNPWAGPPVSFELSHDVTLYRVWGDKAEQVGGWLVEVPPPNAATARAYMALPPENTAQYVSPVLVPAGTRIQTGYAGEAFGQPGGYFQIRLLKHVPASNYGPGVPLDP